VKKLLVYLIVLIFISGNASAISLSEALIEAYKNNPELNAERENLKVSKEDLKIARSEFLPSVTITGSKSEETTEKLTNRSGADASVTDVNPKTQKITVEQKIFQGFAGKADFEKNKIGINLAKAKLIKTEQDVLYKAIDAFSGVLLANEKFEINKENLNLLERQVETDRARLEKGQITLKQNLLAQKMTL